MPGKKTRKSKLWVSRSRPVVLFRPRPALCDPLAVLLLPQPAACDPPTAGLHYSARPSPGRGRPSLFGCGDTIPHSQPSSSGCGCTIPHGRPASFGRNRPPCGRPCTIPHAGCPRCCRPHTVGRARSPTAGLVWPRPSPTVAGGHLRPAVLVQRRLPPTAGRARSPSAGCPCSAMDVPPTAGRARSPTAGRPCSNPPWPASSLGNDRAPPLPAVIHGPVVLVQCRLPPTADHARSPAGCPPSTMAVPPTAGRARSPTAGRPCSDPPRPAGLVRSWPSPRCGHSDAAVIPTAGCPCFA